MTTNEYFEKEEIRVKKLYARSKHSAFGDAQGLAEWFVKQLKDGDCMCYYCETSIHDISNLIDAGLAIERKTGYGTRGRVLEIDKNDGGYSEDTCVLSCYYCNNDKSYTMKKDDYKKYFGTNRKKYFEMLVDQMERTIRQQVFDAAAEVPMPEEYGNAITLAEIRELIKNSNKSYADYLQNVINRAQMSCDNSPEIPDYSIDSIQFEIFADGVVHPFGEVGVLVTDVLNDLGEPTGELTAFRNYPFDRVN